MLSRGIGRRALEGVEQGFKELRDTIVWSSHFYIFPFEMQGCVNITENGLKPEALHLNDYTHVSKVISGDMPLITTWEKSTRWVGSPKRYSFMQCEMGARKVYKPEWGRVFKGAIKSEQHGLNISSNEGWGTKMTELQEEARIVIQTTTELNKEDIFRLYIIKRWDVQANWFVSPNDPLKNMQDRNRVQFLFLANSLNYYSPVTGQFIYSELTFQSLNNRLKDTGYSITNYVNLSYPGVGFAWPMLEIDPDKDPSLPTHERIKVGLDKLRTVDVGVLGAQVKIDNTAIIHSVRLMGYPILWDPYGDRGGDDPDSPEVNHYDSGYVFAPRPLFPKYFLPAVNHPLNTQLKAEENLILVPGIQPVLDFYIDWKEQKKTAYNEMVQSAFEGHLRTNYAAVERQIGIDSLTFQIWKNVVYLFHGRNRDPRLAEWPDWLIDRLSIPLNVGWELRDAFLDLFRSLFANIFSRKLPQYGNVNEKINYTDLKAPTVANILAMNSFAHHDLITLPIGVNQTITTETLDVMQDITARIPIYGGVANNIIEGFHNLVFGKSPSGMKKGGIDSRLNYYGDSIIGLMSKEMYIFYSGPRKNSLNKEHRGIIPFNVFQENSDVAISQMTISRVGDDKEYWAISEGVSYKCLWVCKEDSRMGKWELYSTFPFLVR